MGEKRQKEGHTDTGPGGDTHRKRQKGREIVWERRRHTHTHTADNFIWTCSQHTHRSAIDPVYGR